MRNKICYDKYEGGKMTGLIQLAVSRLTEKIEREKERKDSEIK